MHPVLINSIFVLLAITSCFVASIPPRETVSAPANYGALECGQFETTHRVADLRELTINKAINFPGHKAIITTPFLTLIGTIREGEQYFVCVGTLISDQWVLTAGHCFKQMEPTKLKFVRLGEFNIENDESLPYEHPVDIAIVEVHTHPLNSVGAFDNDLLLLKLSTKVPHRRYDIRPLCLPWGQESLRDFVGVPVQQDGWGKNRVGGSISPESSETTMLPVSFDECVAAYPDNVLQSSFPQGLDSTEVMCAKRGNGMSETSCSHLSGSPLTYQDDTGRVTMIAFVTMGIEGFCISENMPSIYMPLTNVNNLKWIKHVVFNEGSGIFEEGHSVPSTVVDPAIPE